MLTHAGASWAQDPAPVVGEHSLRSRGPPRLVCGFPGLQGGQGPQVLRLLGTRVPLGASEGLRMESGPEVWN